MVNVLGASLVGVAEHRATVAARTTGRRGSGRGIPPPVVTDRNNIITLGIIVRGPKNCTIDICSWPAE